MADRDPRIETAVEIVADVAEVVRLAGRVAAALLRRQTEGRAFSVSDPRVVGRAFVRLAARLLADPLRLTTSQMRLGGNLAALLQTTGRRLAGDEGGAPAAAPVVMPEPGDRRFADEAWGDDVLFDFIKQSYLLISAWARATVRDVDGLDAKTAEKVDFYTRQMVDALAPSNFALTNPTVLRAIRESGGRNLLRGLRNFLADLDKGDGRLAISMTDENAFRLGENIATTPGKVVHQNDLMQLLQFAPTTKAVHRRPLLIVPPWINKYYVLDLRPVNSLIKWLVDKGHTVFVVSWVNPDESLRAKGFDDYMLEGPLAAMDVIKARTGEERINLVGYCIGGTLSACTLAYMAAKKDQRVASATFLTTMIDFTAPGELSVFIDDQQLGLLEAHMEATGYLDGRHMAAVFNMMRANDLIWSFVVNNYLLGRDPPPFDLLYWNADATRMPAMMHGFYLRQMYLENKLMEPGALCLDGQPIDLRAIDMPSYILSTKEDHIAPWKSTFTATRLYAGPVKFVLSASGHIAGVVNPPDRRKYCFWTNTKKSEDPEAWLAAADRHDGSWWPDWGRWLTRHGGGKVPARAFTGKRDQSLMDAPGSYAKVR